jgi:hypothetical protein
VFHRVGVGLVLKEAAETKKVPFPTAPSGKSTINFFGKVQCPSQYLRKPKRREKRVRHASPKQLARSVIDFLNARGELHVARAAREQQNFLQEFLRLRWSQPLVQRA